MADGKNADKAIVDMVLDRWESPNRGSSRRIASILLLQLMSALSSNA